MALEPEIRAWTNKLYHTYGLRGWERKDLTQEVMLRAMTKLHLYDGRNRCSLKTWVCAVGRNHIISLARKTKRLPWVTDDGNLPEKPNSENPARQTLLRASTKDLLHALKENPEGIKHGYHVLNLLLDNHGDYEHAAFALTMETSIPWTSGAIRGVVTRIRRTPRGLALCQALGIISKGG